MIQLMKKCKSGISKLLVMSMFLTLFMVMPVYAEETERITCSNNQSNEVYATFAFDSTETWGSTQVNKYVMTIHNNSGKSICNWEVAINLSQTIQWQSGWGWCADFTASGSSLIIDPLDDGSMGSAIGSGETYGSAGFYLYTSIADFSNVQISYEYGNQSTSNGTGSGSGSGSGGGSSVVVGDVTLTGQAKNIPFEQTPLGLHGELSVDGIHLVDENGENFQLRGISTHGINWFPEYVNKAGFQNLRDEWGVNAVRLAMYTIEYNGYCAGGDQTSLKNIVKNGVEYATDLGMYAIIDWHILNDLTPLTHMESAKAYFQEMSAYYADYDNVIYEICNEPNGGTSWADIKRYAETIIPIIKANNPDAIIIVGTPTWSQDVDIAAQNPITGYTNIMYTVHFYAGTHHDSYRNKLVTALNKGLPVFCTEYGVCESWGGGPLNVDQANAWLDLMDSYDMSYFCWSLCNKDESASLLSSSCNRTSGYVTSDLSASGAWLVGQYNARSGNVTEGPSTDNPELPPTEPSTGNTGIVLADDGRFYYYENGVWNSNKYGFVDYNGGIFLVANGVIADISGLVLYDGTWYFLANGQLQKNYTGLAEYDGEWFYVVNGILAEHFNGIQNYDGSKFMIAAGRILFSYSGLYQAPDGVWYFIANGQVQTQYTGLAMYDGQWFYVVNGVLAVNFTGWVTYDGSSFQIINGMLA